MSYDCTADVLAHKELVARWLEEFIYNLRGRQETHDNSKLQSPEKETFDHWTPQLRELTFGSEQYKAALDSMGEGVKHHYAVNRHHPEHFTNGVDGMTLYDLVEMVCDWIAAAQKQNTSVDLEHLAKRFHLAPQLVSIIFNTLTAIDYVNTLNGVPVKDLAPGLLPALREDTNGQ